MNCFQDSFLILILILPALQLQLTEQGHGSVPSHPFQSYAQVGRNWTSHWRERRSHRGRLAVSSHPSDYSHMSSALRVIGPYFESNRSSRIVRVPAGHDVMLDCAVVLLQGRVVSWLRRKNTSVQLLTVGNQTYSSDPRLGLHFRYPNNWRLGIVGVGEEDEGEYQCQLSTHPPKALLFHLRVTAPAVQILDDKDRVITERHYKVDSSLHLTCRASNIDRSLDHVTWYKAEQVLPGVDGRVKVKHWTNKTTGIVSGFLSVHSIRKDDSGNYSCLASPPDKATVLVHVLNEEHPEAVHYENCTPLHPTGSCKLFVSLILAVFLSFL